MSERKAINKYYPPDYDPSKVPKAKKVKNKAIKVRLSAPFSMRCLKCNEYISKSRKFNATKKDTGEKYLEVKIISFQIRCPICNNNIVFKTHPQGGDFTLESGAKKNFEATKGLSVPKTETPDEILDRLIKEEEENKKFQHQKEERKKNKFWKDKPEDLNDKMVEQHQQVEINEHLEYLQAKNKRLLELESKLKKGETEGTEPDKKKQSDKGAEDELIKEKLAAFKKYQGEKRVSSQPAPLVIKRRAIDKTDSIKTKTDATNSINSINTTISTETPKNSTLNLDYSSDDD